MPVFSEDTALFISNSKIFSGSTTGCGVQIIIKSTLEFMLLCGI